MSGIQHSCTVHKKGHTFYNTIGRVSNWYMLILMKSEKNGKILNHDIPEDFAITFFLVFLQDA